MDLSTGNEQEMIVMTKKTRNTLLLVLATLILVTGSLLNLFVFAPTD